MAVPAGLAMGWDEWMRHDAVALAERVRKAGYHVRLAAQRGERAAYVIRHGRFATRDEAEARIRELARLGVSSAQVVQVQ